MHSWSKGFIRLGTLVPLNSYTKFCPPKLLAPEPYDEAQQATAAAGQNNITAIDLLLEPDATTIQHAKAANARLLKNYPKGFTLNGSHAPHVTMLQRYVKTADLDKVYAAAGKVFAKVNPTNSSTD